MADAARVLRKRKAAETVESSTANQEAASQTDTDSALSGKNRKGEKEVTSSATESRRSNAVESARDAPAGQMVQTKAQGLRETDTVDSEESASSSREDEIRNTSVPPSSTEALNNKASTSLLNAGEKNSRVREREAVKVASVDPASQVIKEARPVDLPRGTAESFPKKRSPILSDVPELPEAKVNANVDTTLRSLLTSKERVELAREEAKKRQAESTTHQNAQKKQRKEGVLGRIPVAVKARLSDESNWLPAVKKYYLELKGSIPDTKARSFRQAASEIGVRASTLHGRIQKIEELLSSKKATSLDDISYRDFQQGADTVLSVEEEKEIIKQLARVSEGRKQRLDPTFFELAVWSVAGHHLKDRPLSRGWGSSFLRRHPEARALLEGDNIGFHKLKPPTAQSVREYIELLAKAEASLAAKAADRSTTTSNVAGERDLERSGPEETVKGKPQSAEAKPPQKMAAINNGGVAVPSSAQ